MSEKIIYIQNKNKQQFWLHFCYTVEIKLLILKKRGLETPFSSVSYFSIQQSLTFEKMGCTIK
jgi:hypothetical protein